MYEDFSRVFNPLFIESRLKTLTTSSHQVKCGKHSQYSDYKTLATFGTHVCNILA
jgi:hypothetical protein